MAFKIGQKLTGKVTGIQPYGIFVQLDENTQGLVHISEVTDGFVENIKEKHKIADEVEVVIMDIDEYSQKISLSIRAAQYRPKKKSKHRKYHPRYSNFKSKLGFKTIEDKMPEWVEESLAYLEVYNKKKSEVERGS